MSSARRAIVQGVAVAWLAGVVAAALGGAALWPLLALGGAGVAIGALVAGRRREAVGIGALVLVALAALARYEGARPPDAPGTGSVGVFNDGGPVTLRGTVVDEPEESDLAQRFSLRVDAYRDGDAWRPTSGKVLVTTRLFPRYRYGDGLQLTGVLQTPPRFDGFDYREYLARRGVVSLTAFPDVERVGSGGSVLQRALAAVRRPLSDALTRSLPEPESALARGILLGERASIPDDVTDEFNRSGISHLVAISGYNVMLVAGFTAGGLAWLIGRREATVVAMIVVVAYALVVGASPPVLRATLMGEVMLGATLAGRRGSALGAVLLAGAALAAWQPLNVDDISFQLSFAATLGMVLFAEPLGERLRRGLARLPEGLAATLSEQAAVTVAASLAVLPIIGASFGRVSLISLPANLIAVPLFPLVLASAFFAALAGAVSDGLGLLAGQAAYLPLAALVRLGDLASGLPYASVSIDGLGTLGAAALYVPVLLLGGLVRGRTPPSSADAPAPLRLRPALVVALVVGVIAAWVWWDGLAPDEGRLSVSILDVGQGDAILIEAPSGRRVLVDGGPSGARLAQALSRELPPAARRIDVVVLSHGQDDHVTGLVTAVERYEVGAVLAGPLPGKSTAYAAWREAVADRGLPLRVAVVGDWIDLGGGARIEVLAPPARPLRGGADDLNDNSVILRLVYGEVSFLLTGDVAAVGEEALLAAGLDVRATVLKVAHHGSDGSTTPALLAAVQPRLAVVSAGAENTYGHPSPTLELALRLAGVPELRTDANGRVRLLTDGRDLWVATERGAFRGFAGARSGALPTAEEALRSR